MNLAVRRIFRMLPILGAPGHHYKLNDGETMLAKKLGRLFRPAAEIVDQA
jgi:hypothetical protein